MTAGYLIKLLQTVDPESNVSFTVGRTPEERKQYAMAELLEGDLLEYVYAHHVEIGLDGNSPCLDIHLLQDNWKSLEGIGEKFKEKFQEVK